MIYLVTKIPNLLTRLLSVALCLLVNIGVAASDAEGAYQLGSGDKINITIFNESDLSLSAKISTNGSIDYPLIGRIKLAGLTLIAATAEIDHRLRGDYLVHPKISITIVAYRPFFISGEVRSPGSYEYQPGMTVRQAITIAGDFTDRASRSKIFLIRENDSSYTPHKVNLNTKMGPGDTVTIKESLF